MELEKLLKGFGPTIRYLAKASNFTEEDVKELITLSWQYGYEFGKQEEELNKGASF